MLSKIKINLGKDQELSVHKSSLFQGVLMEHISAEYATVLHQEGLKPYSQHIKKEGEEYIWEISALNKEAYCQLILPLSEDKLDTICLKHSDMKLQVVDRKVKLQTYKELIEKYYLGKCDKYITIRFVTPTSFKSKGSYVNMPELTLIYKSLMNKFDSFSKDSEIFSMETLEHMLQYSQIVRYSLKSTVFHIEGVKIPSFIGRITVRVAGPQMLVNLVNMLFQYGTYSGVGIKTAMGMGSIQILEREIKNDG